MPRGLNALNLTNQRFGMLTAVRRAPRDRTLKSTRARWDCRCDCGGNTIGSSSNLIGGLVASCGCQRGRKRAQQLLAHGESRSRLQKRPASREYRAWCAMKTRCYNAKQPSYKDYGGRGITVCDRWRESFDSFLADLGRCPRGGSLDRVDVNGHYAPENCRWATRIQQANNTRGKALIEFRGMKMGVSEWARHLDIPRERLKMRLQRGWSVERALTEPPRRLD